MNRRLKYRGSQLEGEKSENGGLEKYMPYSLKVKRATENVVLTYKATQCYLCTLLLLKIVPSLSNLFPRLWLFSRHNAESIKTQDILSSRLLTRSRPDQLGVGRMAGRGKMKATDDQGSEGTRAS